MDFRTLEALFSLVKWPRNPFFFRLRQPIGQNCAGVFLFHISNSQMLLGCIYSIFQILKCWPGVFLTRVGYLILIPRYRVPSHGSSPGPLAVRFSLGPLPWQLTRSHNLLLLLLSYGRLVLASKRLTSTVAFVRTGAFHKNMTRHRLRRPECPCGPGSSN